MTPHHIFVASFLVLASFGSLQAASQRRWDTAGWSACAAMWAVSAW